MGCFDSDNKVGSSSEPDDAKFGEAKKFDPNFKGPLHNRSCTDVICCILFIVFLLMEAIIAFFAFTIGDPYLLILPTNSDGDICGRGKYADKEILLYFDLSKCANLAEGFIKQKGCPTPTICVKECPTTDWFWAPLALEEESKGVNITKREKELICLESFNISGSAGLSISELVVTEKKCAPYYLNSKAISQRCLPRILIDGAQFVGKQLENAAGEVIKTEDNETLTDAMVKDGSIVFQVTNVIDGIVNDISKSWISLVVGIGVIVILTFLYILLLRFFAGIMVWLTLIIFFLGFLGAAGYSFYRYYELVVADNSNTTLTFEIVGASQILDYKETWLAFGIVASIFLLIILVIVIFLRNRLRLAIALIGEASKAIGAMMLSLFFPLFPFVFVLASFGLWAGVCVYLLSIKAPTPTSFVNGTITADKNCTGSNLDVQMWHCHLVYHTGEYWSIILQLYSLFVCLWLLNFVIAIGQITLAGAYASWYWAWEKPKDVPAFPILSSLGRGLRYHMGSMAFGAFLIAVVQFIRILLEYIDRKVKGKTNPLAKFCICCLKCCFYCLEKIVKFITKNAYIMIAIAGRNFCFSAKDAFFLLMRNIVRVVVVDKVTGFVLFVGKLVIAALIGTFAYFFYTHQIPVLKDYAPSDLKYYYVLIILLGIAALIISSLFFVVFDFAVDTLFLCVMEDLERNDGSPEKPFFMSKSLMKVLDKENKFEEKKK